jgi:hypothetical protein
LLATACAAGERELGPPQSGAAASAATYCDTPGSAVSSDFAGLRFQLQIHGGTPAIFWIWIDGPNGGWTGQAHLSGTNGQFQSDFTWGNAPAHVDLAVSPDGSATATTSCTDSAGNEISDCAATIPFSCPELGPT